MFVQWDTSEIIRQVALVDSDIYASWPSPLICTTWGVYGDKMGLWMPRDPQMSFRVTNFWLTVKVRGRRGLEEMLADVEGLRQAAHDAEW